MKKDLLALLFVILLVAVVINGTHIQSVDEYYLTHIDDITPESETVTISIRCDAVLDNYDDLWPELQSDEFVPPDGVILPMSCARGTRYSISWTGPRGTTGFRWNTRAETKTASAACISRASTICMSFPAVLCPAGYTK